MCRVVSCIIWIFKGSLSGLELCRCNVFQDKTKHCMKQSYCHWFPHSSGSELLYPPEESMFGATVTRLHRDSWKWQCLQLGLINAAEPRQSSLTDPITELHNFPCKLTQWGSQSNDGTSHNTPPAIWHQMNESIARRCF